MADLSPLAGLLHRAGQVFSLAGQLGRAFTDEYDRQGTGFRTVDPTAWSRQQPAFNVFCNALLELRDEMQNPPDGFAPVAEVLMEAARVAKQIRDVMRTTDGQMWQSFLEFRFHFNSVVSKGNEAIRAVTKARRLDDPFAFVEHPAAGRAAGIDTTPTVPKPPAGLIAEAARAIPGILANIPPEHDGTIELVAARLAKQLQDAKHSLAAAHWAIHEAVQAGRLRAGLVEVELPGAGVPGPGGMVWHGGGRGTKAIPKGKPAPFDFFKVAATETLGSWWRSLEEAGSGERKTVEESDAETTYDPCEREPRTFRELVSWMVYWATFRNPLRSGLRAPTVARSADHHYLESYCKEMFGGFDLDTLNKLRTRYIVQTSKTVEQIDTTTLREVAGHFRGPGRQAAGAEPPAANKANDATLALMRVFTNGLADDRFEKATRLLSDDTLTVNEKLTKIDALIPFPTTPSAEQLGEMLGVTKQAVLKTDWWIRNRKGEKANEIGRRRTAHQKRAKEYESPNTGADDE